MTQRAAAAAATRPSRRFATRRPPQAWPLRVGATVAAKAAAEAAAAVEVAAEAPIAADSFGAARSPVYSAAATSPGSRTERRALPAGGRRRQKRTTSREGMTRLYPSQQQKLLAPPPPQTRLQTQPQTQPQSWPQLRRQCGRERLCPIRRLRSQRSQHSRGSRGWHRARTRCSSLPSPQQQPQRARPLVQATVAAAV